MKRPLLAAIGGASALFLIIGTIAPFLSADRYRGRLQASLGRALGREVSIGEIRLNLFTGPGFTIKDVVIADDPAISAEPLAYVGEIRAIPRIIGIWTGKLSFSSLTLEDAHLNLARSTRRGGAKWNYEPLLRRGLLSTFPTIRLRQSRINFKFDDQKRMFYLLNADAEVEPLRSDGTDWQLHFKGEPARADRPARGFGSIEASGRWHEAGNGDGHLNLDVRLERSEIGDIVSLINGRDVGVHGYVAGDIRLGGPLSALGVDGDIHISELHGWDQSPPSGNLLPIRVSGVLNAAGQSIDIFVQPRQEIPSLAAHFSATDYLESPKWKLDVRAHRLPVSPVPGVLKNFGSELPEGMRLDGVMDGALLYTPEGGWEGSAEVRDAAIETKDIPTVHFERATLNVANGAARVSADLLTGAQSVGTISADYAFADGSTIVTLASDGQALPALLSKFPMASAPLLSTVHEGNWNGELIFHQTSAAASEWSGEGVLTKAAIALPFLSQPVLIESARVRIDGALVEVENMHASAGSIRFGGSYKYDPREARPHVFRLSVPEADIADAEALLMPTLRRRTSLLDLALRFGQTPAPDWLRTMHADGWLQIELLKLAGSEIHKTRSHIQWDGTQLAFLDVQSHFGKTKVSGKATLSLLDPIPRYSASGEVSGVAWQGGLVNSKVRLETAGTGLQTLTNLKLEGNFSGVNLQLEPLGTLERASGLYEITWTDGAPRFRLNQLHLTSDEDTWTGTGTTQGDGSVLLQLTGNGKQLQLAGSLTDGSRGWVER